MKNLLMLFLLATAFLTFSCNNSSNKITSTENKVEEKKATATKKINQIVKQEGYNVGDKAADFSLKNVDGKMMSLSDVENAKGYIITFTCNHCPYAVMYEDRLINLHNRYSSKGYPVIAINPNDPEVVPGDDFAGMVERAESKAFTFPYLFDEGQKVYPKFGATRTPHVFILDENMVVTYIGAIDDNHEDETAVKVKYVENAIAAMEKGMKPDPSFTKAIGCTIKVKK